jgi:nucleoid-associated protein YgaU
MSKHEKYGDPRSGEEPEGQTGAEGNEGFDDLEGAEDLLKTGLTVGKEVRIGLAVIVVLVIVLGAVVVKRMRHGGDAPAKPAAENLAANAEKSGTSQGKDGVFRPDGPGFGSASRPGRPTVVAALSGPGPEAKPKSPHNEPDTWAFASDNKSKGGRNKAEGHPSPPSFMPKVTEAAESDRSGGSPGPKPAAPSRSRWENDRDTGGSAAISLAGNAAGETPRTIRPLLPSADSRAPLAPSALNPIRSRDEVASARSGERGTGALTPLKPSVPAAPRDTRDQFAPRFGETGGSDSPKASGAAAGSDSPGGRFSGPLRPAGQSGSPGGLALRSDSSPRPGDDSARRPDGTYVVLPNENYWTISQRLFGTGAYFQALEQHNRSKYPRADKLQAGDVIAAPTAAELEKLYPQLCPTPTHREAFDTRAQTASATTRGGAAKVYVVQEGDTLYDIARYELGKPSRWGEIYELNKDVLGKQFDYLSPGMKLALPDSGPAVSQRNEPSPRR